MALTNDYVMPRPDGLPYLDKPIVYFAAEAAAMEVLGPTETAARLPALLFTIATAAAAWWFARRLWGDAEAWLAFIATLASPLSVAFSRTVVFDSALSFFIAVAMMGFYLAIEGEERFALLAWIAIGLGGIVYRLLWITIPFLFFSLSQSKRPQYILPLVPAVALLVARVWCEAKRGTRIAAALLILLGGATIAALRFVHLRDEFAVGARATAISFGLCALIGGVIAFAFTNRRWISFIALSLPVLAIPLCANPLMNGLAMRRSTKELMTRIPPNSEVVGVEAFTGSMAFYLRRPIVVLTPDAEEFTSNYLIRHYDRFAGTPTLRR